MKPTKEQAEPANKPDATVEKRNFYGLTSGHCEYLSEMKERTILYWDTENVY